MCEHIDEYIDFEGEALHADMPPRPVFQFSSLTERINLMSNPTAMVGEVEIMATNSSKDQSMFQAPTTIPSLGMGKTYSQMRPPFFFSTHQYKKMLDTTNLSYF